jgi:hypothetical protein
VLCGGIPGAGDEGDEDSEDDGDYEAGEESSVDEEFGSDDSDDNGEGENTKKRKKKGSDESGSGSGSGSDSVRDQSLALSYNHSMAHISLHIVSHNTQSSDILIEKLWARPISRTTTWKMTPRRRRRRQRRRRIQTPRRSHRAGAFY